jgi:hypothetical protein
MSYKNGSDKEDTPSDQGIRRKMGLNFSTTEEF